MNLTEIIEGLQQELSSFTLSDDTRFNEDAYWWNLVAEKRAIAIRENYHRNKQMNPSVVQDLGNEDVTLIGTDDDFNLPDTCSGKIGKIKIPQIVHVRDNTMSYNDLGVYKVMSSCGTRQYHPISIDIFNEVLLLRGPRANQDYYFRIGQFMYIYPFVEKVRPRLILNNPLDGYVLQEYNVPFDKTKSTEVYKVTEGNITITLVAGNPEETYTKGDSFTMTENGIKTIAGSGKIRHNISKRAMTPNDEYPISYDMMEEIKRLVYNDFVIANRSKGDIVNDSQDEKNLQESL